MKQKIIDNLYNPEALEKLYRENKRDFSKEFFEITDNKYSQLIEFWKTRLAYDAGVTKNFFFPDLIAVMAISLITALLVMVPAIFTQIPETFFYSRDMAIIIFNGLILFTFRQNKIKPLWIIIYGTIILLLLLYVNLLPYRETDSLTIVYFHIPLFLWCFFGAATINFDFRDTRKKMNFIRFNGELLTMAGLLLITGGLLTAITIGLFSTININIENIYVKYIVIPGSAIAPVLASYLIKLYPDITRRIIPVIARVFTPIALVTLIIYFISLAFSGLRILEDRNLLILFNLMLVAVMALIVFSVTGLDKTRIRNINVLFLIMLAVVTLLINSVALIAIINRVTNGYTVNRTVVLITNVLVFVNLILILKDLFRSYYDANKLILVERTVGNYLTVYFSWTVFAIFALPVLFGFN